MPVRGCRVKSSEACPKTVSHRTQTLTALRKSISGDDITVQLQSELRALTKEERAVVLKEANLPVEIPPDYALAMKASLALPWAKMRKISGYDTSTSTNLFVYPGLIRWLKGLHISMGSEARQRALAKDLVGENVVAEMGAFSFRRDGGGEEMKEVPFVHVPSLIKKVADLIEEHKR